MEVFDRSVGLFQLQFKVVDHGTLTNVRFLGTLQLIVFKFEVLLHRFDELLLSLPIILHVHHLLLHLRCVVLQLHVVRRLLCHLIRKFAAILHQKLGEADDFLKVLLKVLHLGNGRVHLLFGYLLFALLDGTLDLFKNCLFRLNILHVRRQHLVDEIKILIKLLT